MIEEQILSAYQDISRLTGQMLAVARNSEWDALVALERECSGIFAQLLNHDQEVPRSNDFQRRKAELIRGALDNDAEIRLLVEPWLTHLSELIGHSGRQPRLAQTYRPAE